MHEGNGVRQLLIDEQATRPAHRLLAIASVLSVAFFEIVAAVCPRGSSRCLPHHVPSDRERRRDSCIFGAGGRADEPIKNPVTGAEHRARIVLQTASVSQRRDAQCRHPAGAVRSPLVYEHVNTYAHLNAFDLSNG